MELIPDRIEIKIILNEKEGKGKQTLSELEKEMYRVLTDIGIDIEEDLVIKDLASNFQNFLFLNRDIVISKEYLVTVGEAKKAVLVFLDLQDIGISNITISKLDHSEITEYKQKVKVEAIKAARQKAELLASAVDQEIGRALYILEFEQGHGQTVSSNVLIRGQGRQVDAYQPGMDESIPGIEFEPIKLRYSILVRFELK